MISCLLSPRVLCSRAESINQFTEANIAVEQWVRASPAINIPAETVSQLCSHQAGTAGQTTPELEKVEKVKEEVEEMEVAGVVVLVLSVCLIQPGRVWL